MSAIALIENMVGQGLAVDMRCEECGTLYYVAPGKPENITHFGRRHLRLHGKATFTGKVKDGNRVVATFNATLEYANELTADKA